MQLTTLRLDGSHLQHSTAAAAAWEEPVLSEVWVCRLYRHRSWVTSTGTCPPYSDCSMSWTVSLRTEVSRMGIGNAKGPPFSAQWLSVPRQCAHDRCRSHDVMDPSSRGRHRQVTHSNPVAHRADLRVVARVTGQSATSWHHAHQGRCGGSHTMTHPVCIPRVVPEPCSV